MTREAYAELARLVDVERFQSGQTARNRDRGDRAWPFAGHRVGDRGDMCGCVAATATDQVEEAGIGPLADVSAHVLGRQIVFPELVWQTGIRIRRDIGLADA